MENQFNSAVKRIRREKGLTQEQLADAVGVSPQAVSKWEAQSYPDAQLIPAIADVLGVTTDELFGREKATEKGFYQQLMEHFSKQVFDGQKAEDIFQDAYTACRSILMGMCGADDFQPIPESVLNSRSVYATYSQITYEAGIMQMRLNGDLQYFLIMPEPQDGFDGPLSYDERMVSLFQFLAVPNALRAMYYIAGRSTMMFFRMETLTRELGISPDNARRIISGMLEFGFVWEATLEGGDKSERIYQYLADCTFPIFLTFVKTMLRRPSSFNFQTNSRTSPYMKHDTYKEQRDEKEKGGK